jgi:adenylate cyclase
MISAKTTNFEYQVGGSLSSHSPSYVLRQADTIIYETLKAGHCCYVLNCRQMGKSSLRVRAMEQLQAEGTVCLFVDLTGMGTQNLTPEKWYAGFVQSLVTSSHLNSKVQWRTWWRERQDLLSPVQRLGAFIEEILLVEIPQKIVIFVDEIDRVLSQNFPLDDFFGLIRCCEEQRAVDANYHRLTFALLGVATPSALVRDKTQTPFNFGKAIALNGFQLEDVQPLIQGLQGIVKHPESCMAEILEWTQGQPFLSQKLCQLVASTIDAYKSVAEVVQHRMIDNWEAQDEPEHLRTIRDRLLRNPDLSIRLLGLYLDILQQGAIPFDGSFSQMELKLSGLVVEHQGSLKVYNRIYAAVFTEEWVQHQLAALRPYAVSFSDWLATNQREAALLRGEALQNALTWALGKRLGDLDYQYLVASQNLDKRHVQNTLTATEQASQLLSTARQTAKKVTQKRWLPWKWLPAVAIGSTIAMGGLNLTGILQGPEWSVFDHFFQQRPLSTSEKQIVVVTVDEGDIVKAGQWPIPDQFLARAIQIIHAQKPAVIGLDIYRNLRVEPGGSDLVKVFQSTSNLFGIEKLAEKSIPPPTILSQKKQVGFSDQILDADGIVRRALLTMTTANQEVRLGLATQLALSYLNRQGIVHQELDKEGKRVRLGKATFQRFEPNDGGYRNAQSGGYQILLNWRGPQEHFYTVSLREVLALQVPPEQWRDRIVLIGMVAESAKDEFLTPYSTNFFRAPRPMPGVFVHANIISQLLQAAQEGRASIQVWSDWLEWFWALGWALVGALLAWYWKSLPILLLTLGIAIGSLLAIGYCSFLISWWIPLVLPAGAMLISTTLVRLLYNRNIENFQFQSILNTLLSAHPSDPVVSEIALEYFKQSESQYNQTLIARHLQVLRTETVIPPMLETHSTPERSLHHQNGHALKKPG